MVSDNEQIQLIKGDCMELLKTYSDNTFDLAIVDPPYGINESGQTNKSRTGLVKATDYGAKDWDKQPPPPEYFDELFRVSKNQIIWGANHFIENMPYNSSCWIAWDKVNGDNDFADCELAWTSFKKAARLFRFMWAGMRQGKSITEGHIMQGNKKLNEKRIHPTQKPVELYRWLMSNCSKKGQKIIDTHLGSASIAIAAHNMDRKLVGIEIDEDYYNDAVKRVERETAQGNLFK